MNNYFHRKKPLPAILLVLILITSCNLPQGGPVSPAIEDTATQTPLPAQPGALPTETWTPAPAAPSDTATVAVTTTPQPTTVLRVALCWEGPGDVYPVVSGLKAGEEVELIGQGSIAGWLIIKNPIYKDPCWVKATDLQLDPNINISALKIVYPPPTPTYTPVPTKTSTPTPTP
jgi:hypothetical protein